MHLEVLERSRSLRVLRLAIHGTRGTVQLSGAEFRRILGYDILKSTLFAVAVDGAYARFAGRGYGHGVGLDQWGAKAMAEQGYTALQILGWRRSLRDDHSGVISAGMHTAGASATPGKGLYVSSAPGMIDS